MAGVVWWQLPAVLNWGLTKTLQQYGLTNVTLQFDEVGISKTSINRFDVTYPDADTTLQIQLNQVSVDYTLSQLVAGQVENLIVESVILKLDYQPSEEVNESPTLPTIEQLTAAFNALDHRAFPLKLLALRNVSISHNLASESVSSFETIELQAELIKQADQLNGKLLLADQRQLNWLSDQDNGWNLEFYDTPEPTRLNQRQAVFKGSLNQVDQSLVFSAAIEPQLLQSWLPETNQTDGLTELFELALTGTIKGNSTTPGLIVYSAIEMPNLGYQEWNVQAINGEFDVQIAQTKPDKQSPSGQINIKSNTSLSLTAARFADWQADELAVSFSSDVSLAEGATKITLPSFLISAAKLKQADELELSTPAFEGGVSVFIDSERWQIEVEKAWQLSGQYARLDETELTQGWVMSSTQSLQLNGALQADSFVLEQTSLDIKIPMVYDTALKQGVQPDNASLKIEQARVNQGDLYVKGLLLIPQLTIISGSADEEAESEWQIDNVSQSFELNNDLLTSQGSAQNVARDVTVETATKHDLERRRGSSDFSFKPLKFSDPQRLSQILSPLAPPVNLVAGEAEVSGQARWRDNADEWQVTMDIVAKLKNLGGAYDEVYFSGANGQLALQVYPEILSKKSQRIDVTHIDAGVPNKDVVVEFALRPSKIGDLPIVDILNARTQLLQGSIHVKPTAVDLNSAQQSLQVVLENIDLNELVTLQQLDDVQATGRVSGVLPLIISNDQVSIDDGQLQAKAPGGVLRYQADAEALQSNKYAETVVLALRDFHYDVLRADTQYKPDGTLLLKLQLEGNNPDFEQGRQINLNINLEQNVLKLLESLRLYDGVSGSLDKQVQELYKQTRPK